MVGPPAALPDRTTRLTFFGALSVLAGAGLFGLAALYAAIPFLGILPPEAVAGRSVAVGALTYAILGAVFVWAGVGSVRRRRWVRPVMLVLAWSWLLAGAMLLAFAVWLLDDLMLAAAEQGPVASPAVLAAVRWILLAGIAGAGVALPALFVWVYRDPAMQDTCERAHPEADWTDACPVPVLGLSLGLGAAAALGLPLALTPLVPVFGWLATGWPGALLTVAGAVACAVLAIDSYRLRPRGWWGSTVLLTALGVSAAVTFAIVEPDELAEALAHLGGSELGLSLDGAVLAWASGAITVLTLVYMLAIRRHFRANPS